MLEAGKWVKGRGVHSVVWVENKDERPTVYFRVVGLSLGCTRRSPGFFEKPRVFQLHQLHQNF
jgi:hypothetical protein